MISDFSATSNGNIQVGIEGAKEFVLEFLDLESSNVPIFLITGRKSYEASGAKDFFSSVLAGRKVVRFTDFSANPKKEDLDRALAAFKHSGARLILTVGGGTAIDLAKLINYFSATGIEPCSYLKGERGIGDDFIPLIAVPTTAGTGSEATHFSALYIGFKKISIADKRMAPSHICLNPAFTASMSPYLSACTGFDALAQAVESYWAVGSTIESRKYSSKALQLCLNHLESAVLNPTLEHRSGMIEAAYLAGKAINISKTTAAHAMSYALTSHYGLPHGHAVAITLPALFEANADLLNNEVIDPRGKEHLRKIMGELCCFFDVTSAREAAKQLKDIIAKIGLSDSWLSEHGYNVKEAHKYIISEVNEERLTNNPCRLTMSHIERIVSHIR